MSREKLLSSPVYWFDKAQNELFRQFHYYMERENINQTQLSERLGVTKGRMSQILTGNSNFRMKSLIELGLSIGIIPKIKYVSISDEIKEDEAKRTNIQNRKLVKGEYFIDHIPYNYQVNNIPNLTNEAKIIDFITYTQNKESKTHTFPNIVTNGQRISTI